MAEGKAKELKRALFGWFFGSPLTPERQVRLQMQMADSGGLLRELLQQSSSWGEFMHKLDQKIEEEQREQMHEGS